MTRPWYREFWPWALMLPPLMSIIGGVAMVYLATQTPGALVVDDYSRIEELTSERFERDGEARRLGLAAMLSFDIDAGTVVISLSGNQAFEVPTDLVLSLRHATDAAADAVLSLRRNSGEARETDGRAAVFSVRGAVLAPFADSRYYVELTDEAQSWRLGSDARRLSGSIELLPQTDSG